MVEFIYLVFTRTPGGVTVGDSGLCCYDPCLSSAIISLGLLILHKRCRPRSEKKWPRPWVRLRDCRPSALPPGQGDSPVRPHDHKPALGDRRRRNQGPCCREPIQAYINEKLCLYSLE